MDEIAWRTTTFFDYWRRRLDFIRPLDLNEHEHEANVLTWAALDALANLWAKGIGRSCVSDPKALRRVWDAFLAQYGGDPFQRVSLPDVWHRADTETGGKLSTTVQAFLKTVGGRRQPTVLDRHLRDVSEDPDLDSLLADTLANCAGTSEATLRDWLCLSRFGAIAYKRMRSPYIHEGRSGKGTHSFQLYDSANGPTYMSFVFGTPAVIGFKPLFMATVLERCISGFEREALATKTDPVPAV